MSATPSSTFASRIAALLNAREEDLRRILGADGAQLHADTASADVIDFKDLAAGDAMAAIQDVTAAHAAVELKAVIAAKRRLAEGTYGDCLDCGDRIDERRLEALPWTSLCTSCQSAHERQPARGQ